MSSINLEDSFSEAHLDIREHLDDGIFYLKDGDLGTVYQFDGIYDEPLTNDDLMDQFLNFFKVFRCIGSIPSSSNNKNVVIQIICSQRRIKCVPAQKYKQSERPEGLIIQSDQDSLFEHIAFIERYFYLSIRYKPIEKIKEESFLNRTRNWIKKTPNLDIQQQESYLKEQLDIFKQALIFFESQFNLEFKIKRFNFQETIQFIQNLLEKNHSATIFPSEYNVHENIRSCKVEDHGDHLMVNENKIECYYLEQLPSEFNLGRFRYFMDQCPVEEWDIIWGLSDIDKTYPSFLMAKEGWYGRQKNQTIFKKFEQFKENVDSLHPHAVQSVRIICYNPPKNISGPLQSVALDSLGSSLKQEKQILMHMYASSFPMNLRSEFNRIKARYKRVRIENTLCFLPIYTGPQKNAGVRWLCSRINTPTKIDLFAGSGNKMSTVLGMSRAGKSVFLGQLYLEFLDRFPDGIIRIIDKKTSSQKLADLLDSRIIRFNESEMKEKIYSPFAIDEWDEDDMESLYLLISTCLMQKNPDCNFNALHSEILKESLKLAYNLQKMNIDEATSKEQIDPHPVWPDILAQMPMAIKNLGSSGIQDGLEQAKNDLAKWSVSLYPTGQYGFIFSKHEKSIEQNPDRLLVYDLDRIEDPVLQQLAAMMAFLKISRDLRKRPIQSPKLIIFEEFGMLLIGDERVQKLNNEFIQNIVKTCAKYQAQAISITNNVADYSQYPAGKTIWENATQKIFLPLGNLYPNAYKAWKDEFNEAEWQIIKSLKIEARHKRSSVYVQSNNAIAPYRGSFYVPLTPSMDALTTTSAPQLGLYKQLREDGLKPHEALNKMASDYPYGENL